MTEEQATVLAEKITKELFALGSTLTPCQRIEFRGGVYTDDKSQEIPQGGLNRDGFRRWILRQLMPSTLIKTVKAADGRVILRIEMPADASTDDLADVNDLCKALARRHGGQTRAAVGEKP
jgi:hypothetical protein